MNLPSDIVHNILQFDPEIAVNMYNKYNIKQLPKCFHTYEFIYLCIKHNNTDIIKYLVTKLKYSEKDFEYCYELAIYANNIECVNIFIRFINVNTPNNIDSFINALYTKNKQMIYSIIQHGLQVRSYMVDVARVCMMNDIEQYLINIQNGFIDVF